MNQRIKILVEQVKLEVALYPELVDEFIQPVLKEIATWDIEDKIEFLNLVNPLVRTLAKSKAFRLAAIPVHAYVAKKKRQKQDIKHANYLSAWQKHPGENQ